MRYIRLKRQFLKKDFLQLKLPQGTKTGIWNILKHLYLITFYWKHRMFESKLFVNGFYCKLWKKFKKLNRIEILSSFQNLNVPLENMKYYTETVTRSCLKMPHNKTHVCVVAIFNIFLLICWLSHNLLTHFLLFAIRCKL